MEKIILDPYIEVIVLFFYILIILAILVVILLFSNLKVEIKNLNLSTENLKENLIADTYKISIILYVLKLIPIIKIDITKDKLAKLRIKEKIKKVNIKRFKFEKIDKEQIKKINRFRPKIKYINLFINIGLEDVVITSYLVALLSSILGIMLKDTLKKFKDNKFIIHPVYNKNLLKLKLNCIIEMKMIHIIYIIYILNKKRRDDKNVRTSNRRAYGYSYE